MAKDVLRIFGVSFIAGMGLMFGTVCMISALINIAKLIFG